MCQVQHELSNFSSYGKVNKVNGRFKGFTTRPILVGQFIHVYIRKGS